MEDPDDQGDRWNFQPVGRGGTEEGRGNGGQTGSVPLRPGRSEEAGKRGLPGGAGEEQRVTALSTWAQ